VNKSLVTNLIALVIIGAGYLSPFFKEQILSAGFFAFSGSITNWLAVFMLFEKIPFLYGSGVIPTHFEDFKKGIKALIMNEFFTSENIDKFFHAQGGSPKPDLNFDPMINALDFNKMYDSFLEVVGVSQFGGMLKMFGGTAALEPLREPFIEKMKGNIHDLTRSEAFLNTLEDNLLPDHLSKEVIDKIEDIINQRLDELTPQMVKKIIQDMIRRHLGWLVVWGGVFGGLIGIGMSFVK